MIHAQGSRCHVPIDKGANAATKDSTGQNKDRGLQGCSRDPARPKQTNGFKKLLRWARKISAGQHRLLEPSARVTLPMPRPETQPAGACQGRPGLSPRSTCHCFLCLSSWQTCQSRERFSLEKCVLSDLMCPHDDCSFPTSVQSSSLRIPP